MSRIHRNQKTAMLAALSIATLLSACGGGGGGTSGAQAPANALTGVAVDGYLQGATVFLDVNRNGTQDASEPVTTTDLNGRYVLDYSGITTPITGLPLVVTGGVDSDTGFAFVGQLSAPVEAARQAQVVTPLTTLVDAMVAQGLAPDVASAKQKVATALSLTVEQLSADPVAQIANNPGIYTTTVALQRSIQLLASANAASGETSHASQERVIKALATAIQSQSSPVNVSDLVASLPLSSSAEAKKLALAITNSVGGRLESKDRDGAKAALRAMDEIRARMESDHTLNLTDAAVKIDEERGKNKTRPYYHLVLNGSIQGIPGGTITTLTQPVNTAGRLLASNCFQCHGTGGVGGFDKIRGKEAAEVKEYLRKTASSSIMAAHAQGYTDAQLNAIITYLQQ